MKSVQSRCCLCRPGGVVSLFCFTGVEVAAALIGKAKTVTVVDLNEAPFQLALGKEVGNALRKVHLHRLNAAVSAVDCSIDLALLRWYINIVRHWRRIEHIGYHGITVVTSSLSISVRCSCSMRRVFSFISRQQWKNSSARTESWSRLCCKMEWCFQPSFALLALVRCYFNDN